MLSCVLSLMKLMDLRLFLQRETNKTIIAIAVEELSWSYDKHTYTVLINDLPWRKKSIMHEGWEDKGSIGVLN